jgi:hypothetical protein
MADCYFGFLLDWLLTFRAFVLILALDALDDHVEGEGDEHEQEDRYNNN